MKMKKLLLGLGTLAAVAAPVAAVVACGVDESKVNYVFNHDEKSQSYKALKAKVVKGTLATGTSFDAQPYAVFEAKLPASITDAAARTKAAKAFVVYELTKTVTEKDGTLTGTLPSNTQEFSKGDPVQIIKTLVQYMKDLGVEHASTFDITIAASLITKKTGDVIPGKFRAGNTAVDGTDKDKVKAAFDKLTGDQKYVLVAEVPAVAAKPSTGIKAVAKIPSHYIDKDGNAVSIDATGTAGSFDAAGAFKKAPYVYTEKTEDKIATLSIDLGGSTEIKDVTEKLINVKASNKSTATDKIKADAWSVA